MEEIKSRWTTTETRTGMNHRSVCIRKVSLSSPLNINSVKLKQGVSNECKVMGYDSENLTGFDGKKQRSGRKADRRDAQ